jgi:glutamate N-acetyltransferase/amino-acid N-acetyltransferase
VDGDRSTNDTLLLFATGQSGAQDQPAGDRRLADFRDKLETVLLDLAHQLVRDGEGADKFIKRQRHRRRSRRLGAQDRPHHLREPAGQDRLRRRGRQLGPHRHGRRPRRRAGGPRQDERAFGDLWAAQDGLVSPSYSEAKMSAYMKKPELEVTVDVGVGVAKARLWTCDLTKRYVEINGDYRS